ncbi:carboxypeptidase-like regulatory domain-containing protein [Tenacibaculum xiamenense]|uniref:carboxypeptidase-like regulatory domain-containing protein n=1 Tax=Tenacibaculum xiamenense TaxID=1261553 RepID=UPI0038942837
MNINKKILTSLLLLLVIVKISSQEKRSFFFAEIRDKFDFLPDVHIINKETKGGTFTNINGEFKIKAKENDTLSISIVGYKSMTWVVKKEHFGIKRNLIFLEKKSIDLDEVEIKETELIGSLVSDSKLVKHEKHIDAETLDLPNAGLPKLTVAERRLYTATNGMPSAVMFTGLGFVMSPDYMINLISGRIKKLRKLKDIETLETHVKKLKLNYTHYITDELKIKKDHVYQFIHFLTEDNGFQMEFQKGEFAVIEFIKSKSVEFKKLKPEDYNKNTTLGG